MRVIQDRVDKRTIVVRTDDKRWFDDRRVLTHRVKQRAYRVWNRSKTQADWEEKRVACRQAQLVYVDAERKFTEWSKSLLTCASNPRKLWSTGKTAIFVANSNLLPLVDR